MANYEETRVTLTNAQLNKLKSAAKNNTGTTLKITKKSFQDEELLHKLFLTKIHNTKIRNEFTKNMSTDIKLCKTQLSKINQSGGFLGNMMSNLGKKNNIRHYYFLAKDVLSKLATNLATKATLSILDKFKRKMYSLFISNEDMNNIIKIVESLKNSGLLIYGGIETVKHEIKNKKINFLAL